MMAWYGVSLLNSGLQHLRPHHRRAGDRRDRGGDRMGVCFAGVHSLLGQNAAGPRVTVVAALRGGARSEGPTRISRLDASPGFAHATEPGLASKRLISDALTPFWSSRRRCCIIRRMTAADTKPTEASADPAVAALIIDNDHAHAETVAESLAVKRVSLRRGDLRSRRGRADRRETVRRHRHRPRDERRRWARRVGSGEEGTARGRGNPDDRPRHGALGRVGDAAGSVSTIF